MTDEDSPVLLGPRAARTREAILAASRELFLRHGYAGTTVADITGASAISRAGFYSYFRDKRDVFAHLGRGVHAECLAVVESWDELPDPAPPAVVAAWVRRYFAYMDRHGAFALAAALSAPGDTDFREAARRSQMQVARRLGRRLRARQRADAATGESPETLGLAVLALIERTWLHARSSGLGVDEAELADAVTALIVAVLAPDGTPPPTGRGSDEHLPGARPEPPETRSRR